MIRICQPAPSALLDAAPAQSVADFKGGRGSVSLLDVAILVLWSGCLGIGIAGFGMHYARPLPIVSPVPLQAELLNVELSNDPLPPLDATPPPKIALNVPPPVPEDQPIPAALPLAAASAEAAVAFPLPVEGPVQIVAAAAAPAVAPAEARVARDSSSAAPVQSLTYGVGEGRQLAPEYPRSSLRAGQEGTVRVRFTVGDHGRVLAAEAAASCPWPLLNESAVRVVRERWRFRPGAPRFFEVSIRFELRK